MLFLKGEVLHVSCCSGRDGLVIVGRVVVQVQRGYFV